MEQIKELPPGAMFIFCSHLVMDTPDDLKVSNKIVWLNEIPEEIGYHGTCLECGSKYFSRPDGAF